MDDIANVVAGPEKADRRDMESLMSGYCIANHRHIRLFVLANTRPRDKATSNILLNFVINQETLANYRM